MDGDASDAVTAPGLGDAAADLPTVLARLDADQADDRRAAIDTIRESLADRPGAYLPAVPKLRTLLEDPESDAHEEIAYCLAELAIESPTDVAPSTDVLVAFADQHPTHPATGDLLRCLAVVAAASPSDVADHVATIADVIDRRPGYDSRGLRLIQRVSVASPDAVEPAVPILSDALAADPEENGVLVLSSLGRFVRSAGSLPTLAFVDPATTLVDHEETALRRNAVGCLADVAWEVPSAVEPATADLADVLAHEDPETRANAAAALARVAAGTDASLERVETSLLAVLEDDRERVRANACVAIGHGRLEGATDRLEALAREDPSAAVRERAEWALNRRS